MCVHASDACALTPRAEKLTRWVYEHGGSIDTSKMLRLGGEFTVMLWVSAPTGLLAPLRTALHEAAQACPSARGIARSHSLAFSHTTATSPPAQHEFEDLYIHTKEIDGRSSKSARGISPISRQTTKSIAKPVAAAGTADVSTPVCVRIRCSGADKPGMLYKIADFLSTQHLNIDDLQTELRSTMLGGEAVSFFMVHGEVTGTGTDVKQLRRRASVLARELDIFFEIDDQLD